MLFVRNAGINRLSVTCMGQTLQQRWRGLTAGQPGRRFEDRYAAARKARRSGSWGHRLTRLLLLVVALGALVVGLVLAFIPGPAVVFFFLAATLLAAESRGLARLLDWGEVKLRIVWKAARRQWAEIPGWGRVVLMILGAGISAASAYFSYQLVAN